LYINQRNIIYAPPRVKSSTESTLAIPTSSGTTLAVARPHDGDDAVIYLGGNAEDVTLSVPTLAAAFPDVAMYALHYRGYGGSSGLPSEEALFADALALFDEVQRSHRRIQIVGRSMGAGVAVYVASRRPVARLVLVTPYDSLQNLAAQRLPIFPVSLLLRDKYESWRYAPKVSAPTLIIMAERDEVVPRRNTEALLASFRSGVAKMKLVPGVTHNSIHESPQYRSLIQGSFP
jgi:pimeloyl-ACP methyl ester carboxylesterase